MLLVSTTAAVSAANGTLHRDPALSVIAPLAVSGLIVTKAALLAALAIYVPQLRDIEVMPDDRYLLLLATSGSTSAAP